MTAEFSKNFFTVALAHHFLLIFKRGFLLPSASCLLPPELAAQFRRLSARRGKQRAAVAVAHSILVIAYHLISRQEPYKDLGADYFDKQQPESVKKRLIKRLEKLGYQVTVQSVEVAV